MVGPPPPRARSSASFIALYVAMGLKPSHTTPGTPYPGALSATLATFICISCGVEIAHSLFSTRNTIGRPWTAAKLTDSCHSPCEVAPSPVVHRTARAGSPRYLNANATPTACVQCDAMIEEIETTPRSWL